MIPSFISLLRVVIAVALFAGWINQDDLLFWLFIAAMSDFIDGWLARGMGWVTKYGKTFDLTADGLFFLSALWYFWQADIITSTWFWLLIIAAIPEIIAQVIWFAKKRGVGSGGRVINKILGVYSYIAMIGIASSNAVIPLLVGQVVLTSSINLYDLWRAITRRRSWPTSPMVKN